MLVNLLLCSSVAFSSKHPTTMHLARWGVDRSRFLATSARTAHAPVDGATTSHEAITTANKIQATDARDSKREIVVQTSLEVPFSATVAFDVFSDLPRQADFSPWLRSVEYVNPPGEGGANMGETKWTMAFMGLNFTWNSIASRLERPHILEWKSTSGLKNFGRVDFSPIGDNATTVTMTMTFVAPRVLAGLFRRSSALANAVQNRIIRTTLINFRDTVIRENLA